MLGNYEKKVDDIFRQYFKKYHNGFGPRGDGTNITKFKSCKQMDQGPVMHRYKPPEQGYHIWHADWSPWSSITTRSRMVVGMLYLNDVYIGGETEFYHQQISTQPRQGTIVVWPAYFTHTHRGNKPISNTKYIINKWGVIEQN